LINTNCLEGEHVNWSERVAVTGVGGRVFVENWRRVIGLLPDGSPTYYWEPEDIRPADDQNSLEIHGFVGELRDFLLAVRDDRPPAATIDDGIAALRLERAIERSVRRGARVMLSEATDDVE
jgi:predicted dehydrogenase